MSHRAGDLQEDGIAVWVVAGAPRRDTAFKAFRRAIDRIELGRSKADGHAQDRPRRPRLKAGLPPPRWFHRTPPHRLGEHHQQGWVREPRPFSFFTCVSHAPPMLSISVGQRENEMKDTAPNILETQGYVIHTWSTAWRSG